MYISYFLCRFHLRLVANANPVSSGIWALDFAVQFARHLNVILFVSGIAVSDNTVQRVIGKVGQSVVVRRLPDLPDFNPLLVTYEWVTMASVNDIHPLKLIRSKRILQDINGKF